MTRIWIATALLAGSWLLGLDYIQPAHPLVWLVALAVATALLSGFPIRWPSRRQMTVAVILLLPPVWMMPLPYKSIPLLLAVGLGLQLAPIIPLWPRKLGQGAAAAAGILLIQSLVLEVYTLMTARSHELPSLLAGLSGVVARLLRIDATRDGSTIAMRSMQEMHRFAATWELLLDPATVCFFSGGLAALALLCCGLLPRGNRRNCWLRGSLVLLGVTLAWVPLRVALMLSLVLHRALCANAITASNVADVLVNAWVHMALLAGPALLAARLIRRPSVPEDEECLGNSDQPNLAAPHWWAATSAPLLFGLGIVVLVVLWYFDPVGGPKAGRVMFVERHSTWEPTTEPYRTTVYGEAGSYNYGAIFEYCGQYYEMSQLLESEAIDDKTLKQCDTLVIKTPTERYTKDEVASVVRFVRRGGSLFLIGDHTNVFNMNTYLNDMARHFGFTFRNDLLFRVGTPYKQKYRPPVVAHPIVQHVPEMDFAVSCSIDPGRDAGRMIIRSTGLWNLPPAYQESNYHPQAEYRSVMQYGAWCQLWSTCHGNGRVVAFADSTLFSNFCVFQPGKRELLMGMLEWLNHHSSLDRFGTWLLVLVPFSVLGVALIALSVWRGRSQDGAWMLFAAVGLAAWTVGAMAIITYNSWAMPRPEPERGMAERSMAHVVIDRTVSEVPLFTGAFADDGAGKGYGMLEQWIPRVGNFISRREGAEAFIGDGLVIICPTRSVSESYRDRLVRFVSSGGKLLVVDSLDVEGSTANSLLRPFGLASNHDIEPSDEATLTLEGSELTTALQAACEITGGEPLASLAGRTVAARVNYGEGTVTAIGFGSLFNDASMGHHWLLDPDADTLNRYEVLYALLRAALPAGPAPPQNATLPPAPSP